MLRFLTAGESHGPSIVVILEGMPAGVPITVEEISGELARPRLGYGRGPRMRFEGDEVSLIGGIRHGRTIGAPVAIEIANTEWPKWEQEMAAAPGYPDKVLTQPRLASEALQKFGGDSLVEVVRNRDGFLAHLEETPSSATQDFVGVVATTS